MKIEPEILRRTHERLIADAEAGGYHLNPDEEWTLRLIEGLLINGDRYDYWACPCRLASGSKEDDLDIICPCDYRDSDLLDYGACYCGLYVSDEVLNGQREVAPLPERRPQTRPVVPAVAPHGRIQLWRCRVCGYLCAREHPPGVCPICKARGERFEVFVLPSDAISAVERHAHDESSKRL